MASATMSLLARFFLPGSAARRSGACWPADGSVAYPFGEVGGESKRGAVVVRAKRRATGPSPEVPPGVRSGTRWEAK